MKKFGKLGIGKFLREWSHVLNLSNLCCLEQCQSTHQQFPFQDYSESLEGQFLGLS